MLQQPWFTVVQCNALLGTVPYILDEVENQ